MRPRLFIGSSYENISIANSIKNNLEEDSDINIWDQDIFIPSSTNLDSLINSLNSFDYAIFVFHPDDITLIRDNVYNTVRDNLIFELGLFMGKLGKEKVFFVVPASVENLHLPTDLAGVVYGTYDNTQADNLNAPLVLFCEQVKKIFKDFVYTNIEGVQEEPQYIKEIIVEKKIGWENLFTTELLEHKLEPIDTFYKELFAGLLIGKVKQVTTQEYFDWFRISLTNFQNYTDLFGKCLTEISKTFNHDDYPVKPIEIKNAIERLMLLCNELINWEYEAFLLIPPDEVMEVKKILCGWTKKMFIDEIHNMNNQVRSIVNNIRTTQVNPKKVSVVITPQMPVAINDIVEIFRSAMLE